MRPHVIVTAPEMSVRSVANLLRGCVLDALVDALTDQAQEIRGHHDPDEFLALEHRQAADVVPAWTLKGRGPRRAPVKRAKR